MIKRTTSILALAIAGCLTSFSASIHEVFKSIQNVSPDAIVVAAPAETLAEMPYIKSAEVIALEKADSTLFAKWTESTNTLSNDNKIIEVEENGAIVNGWLEKSSDQTDNVGVLIIVREGENAVALLTRGSEEMLKHLVNGDSPSIINL